jgi:peptidoglycan/xylan/chitin deacetylase (PgdA/CDA1 family)
MTNFTAAIILIALCILTGCSQPLMADSSDPTALPTTMVTETPRLTNTPIPTLAPTQTAVPTATTSPTWTPQPTETAVLTMTPTATMTPTRVSACRPAAPTSPHVAISLGPWPRPPASANVLGHGPYAADKKFIHLSFDVEGDGRILGSLLNVLDKHQVKTTLFIVGSWAEQNSYWVTEATARGHEFASHSYSHTHLRQLTPDQIQAELQKTEEIVMHLTGQTTKPWLRPPYGGYSEETVQAAYEAGWTTVTWSGTGADTIPDADEITICNALVQYAEPGAILLLHTSHPEVVTAVDRFITEMHAQGYTIVPLSIMMGN